MKKIYFKQLQTLKHNKTTSNKQNQYIGKEKEMENDSFCKPKWSSEHDFSSFKRQCVFLIEKWVYNWKTEFHFSYTHQSICLVALLAAGTKQISLNKYGKKNIPWRQKES